jgi:hypothetical protein
VEDRRSVPQMRGKRVWNDLCVPTNSVPRVTGTSRIDPQGHRACLIRAVSSCTRLYTDRSSRMSRVIFDVAWMTVV